MQRITDSDQVTSTVHVQVTPQQLRNIADKFDRAAEGAVVGSHLEYEAAEGLTLFYEPKAEVRIK